MKRFCLLLLAGVALAQSQPANSKTADERWKSLDFLVGKWTGSGAGDPGSGAGEFSFDRDLNNHILTRRSFNQTVAGREAGSRHDDLLIVYADSAAEPLRAIYFDSEGHVIRYRVTSAKPNTAVFESEPSQPGPRYRLSYDLNGAVLAGKFEVAPPGSEFKPYLTWTSKRQ